MYKASQAFPLPPVEPFWRELVFFDIETTGFSAKYHRVGLISLAYLKDNYLELIQYFAETPEEEPIILTLALTHLSQFLAYVSYNGDRFDIPFLNQRAKHHAIGGKLNPERSIDLYRINRQGKLKQAEEVTGYERTDLLSGEDWAKLYRSFHLQPSSKVRDELLLHNSDDVLSLTRLLLSPDIHHQVHNRVVLTQPAKLITRFIPGRGNLRVLLTDASDTNHVVDLPLIDTPTFSVLNDPTFDSLDELGKQSLVLIEHGEMMNHRIKALLEANSGV